MNEEDLLTEFEETIRSTEIKLEKAEKVQMKQLSGKIPYTVHRVQGKTKPKELKWILVNDPNKKSRTSPLSVTKEDSCYDPKKQDPKTSELDEEATLP
jgi:hypothetical protein